MEGELSSSNGKYMLTVRDQGQVCLVVVVKVLGLKKGVWKLGLDVSGSNLPTMFPSRFPGTLLLYCFLQVFFHSSHWVFSISSGYRARLTTGSSSRTLSPHILKKGIIRGHSSICPEVPNLAWDEEIAGTIFSDRWFLTFGTHRLPRQANKNFQPTLVPLTRKMNAHTIILGGS